MLFREIKSECWEGWLYSDDMTLIVESFEGFKGKLEACKEAMDS